MAIIRILVDGYSLLHAWPELARGRPRHSTTAREELIRRLQAYQDASGTPITVFFDGARPVGTNVATKPSDVEVLYSRSGQTADQMIERVAHRFQPFGEVLAVTDDLAERDTVISLGGAASSCLNFVRAVEAARGELAEDLHAHNRRERNQF